MSDFKWFRNSFSVDIDNMSIFLETKYNPFFYII